MISFIGAARAKPHADLSLTVQTAFCTGRYRTVAIIRVTGTIIDENESPVSIMVMVGGQHGDMVPTDDLWIYPLV